MYLFNYRSIVSSPAGVPLVFGLALHGLFVQCAVVVRRLLARRTTAVEVARERWERTCWCRTGPAFGLGAPPARMYGLACALVYSCNSARHGRNL